jgi:putative Mg2+ transporter-C (MgtC) family protein
MNIGEILLKLVLAIVLGGIIGIERETSHKPAGFRTHILICITSAMMMLLATGLTGTAEAVRMAAGIITGVGFLGAGAIIQSRGSVHGLTTASTIWAVAGLGLAVGAGYYVIAVCFTVLVELTLIVFRKIDRALVKRAERNDAGLP